MLEDRVYLITGSHSGIGNAVAKACLEAGARVAIHARTHDELDNGMAKLEAGAVGFVGDLLDDDTPSALVNQTVSSFGRLDGIVNNAALIDRSTIEDVSSEHLDAMFRVNVTAPLLLIQAALPHLEESPGGGSIVNIGSINAYCGAPNLLAYSASKAALMTSTRNLGDALGGRNVRINQINVGWTLTENERVLQRAEGRPEDWTEHLPAEFAPHGRLLRPQEIAAHAIFWLSDASRPATGQVYELEQYPIIGRNRISTR